MKSKAYKFIRVALVLKIDRLNSFLFAFYTNTHRRNRSESIARRRVFKISSLTQQLTGIKPSVSRKPSHAMALSVISTNLYPLENAMEHHADRFELVQNGSTAIFRRGQPFYLAIRFNRSVNPTRDIVRIVLVTGAVTNLIK